MRVLNGLTIFTVCLGLGLLIYSNLDNSAEIALEEFYNYKGFDDKRTEPLYKAKAKVTPLLIEKVKNKDMLYRLQAIQFLGSNKTFQALPVLAQIVNDKTEDDFVRKKTLQAIFWTDENYAKKLAIEHKNTDNFLGKYSTCILTEKVCI